MKVNLGQSQFQDTFFVAGSQHTPFRRLRQIELELRSLESSLKTTDFSIRRIQIKMSKMDRTDPLEAIDYEEAEWELSKLEEMIADAEGRKANFEEMKKQLLAEVPQEYWDRGFENAELDHWVLHISKHIAMSKSLNLAPQANIIEMWLQLPESAQQSVLRLSMVGAQQLLEMERKAIEAEAAEPESSINKLAQSRHAHSERS